ncbi:DDE superfamily endonuclease [Nonomuraea fuscirosea]|uniref:DDE superfamily endonuclease n=1 Tax=Nonomuraea fuscirosea TaxID=1291556 RepID=A0A2T0LK16_9ACTN|nr:transposase [Nonomuraea fuscirosea]PRX42919.1 DDE superfamily endonuclease [Nonomuraea fuscirosea]
MFKLADALLCELGPVRSPVDLSLSPEYRRGHDALYGGLNHGRIDTEQLPDMLAALPLPRWPVGRIVLAADVSRWLRSDVPCSAERLLCPVYGRAKSAFSVHPGSAVLLRRGAGDGPHIVDSAAGYGPAGTGRQRHRSHRRRPVESLPFVLMGS